MGNSNPPNGFLKENGLLITIGLLIVTVILLVVILINGPTGNEKAQIEGQRVRDLANKLFEWKLYEQSIEQYKHYLDFYSSDEKEQSNINYIIGNIYFDRLHDYEGALTHYAKVKFFYPESKLVPDVNKKIVACLERTQRTQDAHQMLEETTSLDTSQVRKSRPGEVVAKIGDRNITQGDLDFEISQLPPMMQSQFNSKEAKEKFLEQFIATELLYETAKRASLDKDKDVIEGTFQAKKRLMAQKYAETEIVSKIDIKPEDVELFYKANKERYVEKDKAGTVVREKPLSEVQQQVVQDLAYERQTKAYEELIQRLTRAQSVEIYNDKIQ